MEIDEQLAACGWVVQDYKYAAVAAAQGVAAVRTLQSALAKMQALTESLTITAKREAAN